MVVVLNKLLEQGTVRVDDSVVEESVVEESVVEESGVESFQETLE